VRAKLSQELVDTLLPEPGPSGKANRRVWDTTIRGFGCYVSPSGSKAYFVAYRIGRKERRATLGKTPPMTCTEARKLASRYLVDARAGIDPLAAREQERNRRTLAGFWPEFLADAKTRWKPSTLAENSRLWKLHIAPKLGDRPLDAIARGDVSAWHRAQRDTPAQANMALRLLKSMFGRAVAWEFLAANPAVGVDPYPEGKHERFLASDEYAVLFTSIAREEAAGGSLSVERPTGERLAKIEAELVAAGETIKRRKDGTIDRRQLAEPATRGITPHSAALFRLLALTGARLGEVMRAKWEWVRWDERCLALPDSKTGAKRVALSTFALEELTKLKKFRTRGNGWIVEGGTAGGHLVSPHKPWRRICDRAHEILNERRKEAKLAPVAESVFTDLRIHDLRHSFASTAVAEGLSLAITGKALGHRQARTTERYAHLAADPVLEAVDRVGAAIVEAVFKPHAVVEEVAKR